MYDDYDPERALIENLLVYEVQGISGIFMPSDEEPPDELSELNELLSKNLEPPSSAYLWALTKRYGKYNVTGLTLEDHQPQSYAVLSYFTEEDSGESDEPLAREDKLDTSALEAALSTIEKSFRQEPEDLNAFELPADSPYDLAVFMDELEETQGYLEYSEYDEARVCSFYSPNFIPVESGNNVFHPHVYMAEDVRALRANRGSHIYPDLVLYDWDEERVLFDDSFTQEASLPESIELLIHSIPDSAFNLDESYLETISGETISFNEYGLPEDLY